MLAACVGKARLDVIVHNAPSRPATASPPGLPAAASLGPRTSAPASAPPHHPHTIGPHRRSPPVARRPPRRPRRPRNRRHHRHHGLPPNEVPPAIAATTTRSGGVDGGAGSAQLHPGHPTPADTHAHSPTAWLPMLVGGAVRQRQRHLQLASHKHWVNAVAVLTAPDAPASPPAATTGRYGSGTRRDAHPALPYSLSAGIERCAICTIYLRFEQIGCFCPAGLVL